MVIFLLLIPHLGIPDFIIFLLVLLRDIILKFIVNIAKPSHLVSEEVKKKIGQIISDPIE